MIATHREGGRYSDLTTIALEQLDRRNYLAPLYQSPGTTLAHDRRVLVYQVTQALRPLWQLDTIEEFKQCYVELMEAHFQAYNRAHILHGDISASNAMARRDAEGKVFGFLSDWDLSCLVDARILGTSSTSRHRTGTAPFMAMDLQRAASKYSVTADHRYCHDLESFFWLLLWAVLHFDRKRKRHRNCTHEDWIGSCRECSAGFKRDFITYGGTWDRVVDDVLDMWQPIMKRWVKPLARMIYSARERSTHWNDDNLRVFDDDVYAKELTFEAFMQRIKQTPRDRTHEEKSLRLLMDHMTLDIVAWTIPLFYKDDFRSTPKLLKPAFPMADPSSNASDSEGSECSCCSLPATPEDLLTPALREELESRVIDHRITVEQFVRTVYGVDNALIQRDLALNVTFPREHLQEYMDGLVRGESNETSCRPFQAIFDACVRAVREELDITDDPPLKLFTETSGYFGRDLQRMPGGIFLTPAACREAPCIDWRLVHHVLVFEENHSEGDESLEDPLNDVKERSDPYDLDAASHHRRPTSSLSPHEMKGAQYALECMNADTSRYYATVLCVDGTKVWLLYIGRDFIFHTTSFNFVEYPHLLAVVAYAMVYCTPLQAGFDPHLQFPVTAVDGTATCTNNVAYPRELAGAQFVFPESQGQPALSFIAAKGLSRVARDAIPSVRDAVTCALKDTNSDGEEMELKVCWTPRGRTPEPLILKTLHKTLPNMVDHLPVIEVWRVVEPICPLLALFDEENRRDSSCLAKSSRVVYQVTPRFMPLWELNSVEKFKECFVDIVEVHHRAFERDGVIHANIGEHSAMSHRKRGRALGVLKDWDCARLPNDPAGPPGHQFGTGAGTFMAVEVQQNAGTQHRYHHDLESFLFLLVWATLHFDLENKRRLPSKLPDWQDEWQMAASKKRSFITDPDTFNEVIQLALPQFRDVVDGWVFPLVTLFRDAMRAADVVKVDAEGIWERHFDEDIYAENITFEAFLHAIGKTPRKWLHEEM